LIWLGAAALVAMATVVSVDDAWADDVVVLRDERPSAAPSAEMRRLGEIVEYTGAELKLRTASGRVVTYPSRLVERIESSFSKSQEEAEQLLDAGKPERALEKYRQALGEEKRAWARRRILSGAVWAYQAIGRPAEAGKMFLAIYDEDPTTPHFDCIPLAWRDDEPPIDSQAARWLADSTRSAAMLLGASRLLLGGEQAAAITALERLTTDGDARVALLAEAQLWRIRLAGLSDEEIERRRTVVERLEVSLRAGPYFVLGQSLAQHHRAEQAALAWMRIPIHYPRQRRLASAALIAAGGQLEKIERSAEAARLYREAIGAAGESNDAQEAQLRLKRIEAKN
jgi:tetratricopeptide (TPR) repeat protein